MQPWLALSPSGRLLVLWSQSIKIDVINWLISLFINIFMLSFHEMNGVYYLNAHNQYEWHDGSWDEPESISILDAIHVYGWDPHTGDMYSKSYTWISSQPVMRLDISSDKVAVLWLLWDSVICLDHQNVRFWIIVLVHWMYWRTMRSTLWTLSLL